MLLTKSLPRPAIIAILAAFAALFLAGCATPSTPAAMTAKPVTAVTKNPESLGVNVTGGGETSSMGASNISDADFATAIKTSIADSGLFAKITASEQADYLLSVAIVRLDRPLFGASFTVNFEATWRLSRRSDQKLIWEKSVASSFTATMGDAFVGVTRLRLANEGAARTNIQDAITQMSALSLR